MIEQTLVLIKPDGMKRKLGGKIISIFEEAGLEIKAIKMLQADRERLTKHYPSSEEWLTIVGNKTLDDYKILGKSAMVELGTDSTMEIGKMIKEFLVTTMSSTPIIAMILEGNEAVRNVRRICGHTLPVKADPGSIRGRFGVDSPDLANAEKRPVMNLIHASGEPDEARFEIGLWFPEYTEEVEVR